MNSIRKQSIQKESTTKDILYELQWHILLLAIILTSVGLFIDVLQNFSAFKWVIQHFNSNSNENIIHSNYSVYINSLAIFNFIILIYLQLKNKINVSTTTLWFSVVMCLCTAIPYLWFLKSKEALVGYILRDMMLFTIIAFVVSTCTFGKFVYHIAIYIIGLYIIVALFSNQIFLLENMPVFIFMIGGFAFFLWKKDNLLKKLVKRQNDEKKKVEELSLFKERMNSMLFHDIKVPLNNINRISFSDMSHTKIHQIRNQVEHVNRMLSNMIDIASSTDTKISLNETDVLLQDVINYSISQMQYIADYKGIEIHYSNDLPNINIKVDKDLFERALINIIENAIKYSPEKSSVIINTDYNKKGIQICITDKGSGILNAEKMKIFDLFYTSERSKESGKSSGIGLAFCKLVIQNHDGSIDVESPVSGGTMFLIKLPVNRVSDIKTLQETEIMDDISKQTIKLFHSYYADFKKHKYFHTSEIYKLFNTALNQIKSPKIKDVEVLRKMALSCNNQEYNKFLSLIS